MQGEGYCQCGCGAKTSVVPRNDFVRGEFKGQYRRFVVGHGARRYFGPEYIEDPETGCWDWQHRVNNGGYGTTGVPGRGSTQAHRVYYERLIGPIPEGLTLDHLCRNRRCVNPDHLEPVTIGENVRRGLATKLSDAEVAEILGLTEVATRELAGRYGVTPATVTAIRHGYGRVGR